MIISPPFLPARGAGQSEEDWINSAMPAPPSRLHTTGALEGSFPLSHNLSWHNGMHIQAPTVDGAFAPARAIADGTVVFASPPKEMNTDVDDAQNYNPFDRQGAKTAAWTDNGCVIIEHCTTIGAEGTVETEVVFYSLYMHLSALGKITPPGETRARPLAAGDAIWRKSEVGSPGQVYGHAGQIHFEVCFNAENLQRLIGRAPNWIEPATAPATLPAPTAEGRTDAVFGSLYFYLPAITPTQASAAMPTQHVRGATPSPTTLGTALWVKMTYDAGSCTFESYDERGVRIAALPAEADAEYDLYQQAAARHNALPAAEQTASSPSGWYELLRFGRNIGRGTAATDKDPLPVNAAHWRRIPGPSGTGIWADLNAPGTFKFSDADFPPVMGWNCIDDDTSPDDQRCDSVRIKNLIRDPDATNESRMEPEQLERRLGDTEVQRKLRRAFCKFPSEWDKGTVTARYGFVQETQPFKDAPEAWPRLEAHLKGISFNGLPPAYLTADWHGHPRLFIEKFRKCLWLSQRELIQMVPKKAVRGTGAGMKGPFFYESIDRDAGSLIPTHHRALNLAWRKYCITTHSRLAAFIGNSIQETRWWSTTTEIGGSTLRYAPWYGRGFLQLTNSDGIFSLNSNYGKYFLFRGRNVSRASSKEIENWRIDVGTVTFDAADSAGVYWAWNRANREVEWIGTNLRRSIVLAPKSQLLPGQTVIVYENAPFRRVACLVNLPGAIDKVDPHLNGLVDRYSGYIVAQVMLFDVPMFPNNEGKMEEFPELFLPRRPH